MKVALTGATGYTGSRLLRALLDRGDEVRALVRPSADASAVARSGAQVVAGDLTQDAALGDLVQGVDAVLHVAAVYRTAGHKDEYYREINVDGTRRLLEAATRASVSRFVHTSTVGVHGDVRSPPAEETSPIAPGDVYQDTKAEGEALAFSYHRERALPVAVVRPGAIYGPGERRLLKLFRAVARGLWYANVGDGRALYHLVFIDDLVSGFLLALDHPSAVGEAFIIAGPRYLPQAELARTIARHTGGRLWPFRIPARPIQWAGSLCEAVCVPLGVEPPLHRRRVDFFVKSRAFSIEKARRILGYDPKVDVDEGVARTVRSYREAGWL